MVKNMSNISVEFPIDIVIPWVNGADPLWIQKKQNFVDVKLDDIQRYRDFGTLKYVLRSIEKFAPWVNTIYLVTDNQMPEWLKINSKIKVVDHSEFIPKKFLPTFNSNAIELNVWRIKDLSDHFILFNDDTLLTQPVTPNDFFSNEGEVVDTAAQFVLMPADDFAHTAVNNISLINQYFDKRQWLKNNFSKALSLKNGPLLWVYSVLLSPLPKLTRFYDPHIPLAYTKQAFQMVTEIFLDDINRTSSSKVRSIDNVSQWLVRYFQLMNGNFIPSFAGRSRYLNIQQPEKLRKVLHKKRVKMIVLNDTVENEDDEKAARKSIELLDLRFPEKSSFER
ncbi:stealth family protein [Weissella confusa]